MPDKKGRLTHQEKVFIERMAATGDPTYAAYKAGYASPQPRGSENMSKPAIAAAVREAQQARLHGKLRDLSIDALERTLSDPKAPYRDTTAAAKVVFEQTKTPETAGGGVDLAQLTADELGRLVEQARQSLASLRTISPVIDAEPVEPPRLPDPLPSETSVFS